MIELKAQYRVDIIINLAKQNIPVLIVVESKDHKIISPAVANIKTEAIVFPCVRNIIIITNISDPIIATGTTKVIFGIRKLGIHQGLFPTRFKFVVVGANERSLHNPQTANKAHILQYRINDSFFSKKSNNNFVRLNANA